MANDNDQIYTSKTENGEDKNDTTEENFQRRQQLNVVHQNELYADRIACHNSRPATSFVIWCLEIWVS